MPKNDVYRQAASVLVLRPSDVCVPGGECTTVYQMLLLHKARRHDAWQLPQGGIEEGENVEQAALRELNEEAGITGAQVFGKSEECYQYDFPASYRRFRRDHVCGQCIRFVYATVDPDVVVHVDGVEINNHQWIDPAKLSKYLTRSVYADLVTRMITEAMELLSAKTHASA